MKDKLLICTILLFTFTTGCHGFIPIPPDQLMSWLAPERCPESCPHLRLPVCGSDDVTYQNECILKQEICKQGSTTDLSMQQFGECSI